MQWFEPLIIIAAISFVGLVIFLHFYLKKKGKSLSGCSGNCAICKGCKNKEEKLKEYKSLYSKTKNN